MWALFSHEESGDAKMEMEFDIQITKKDLYDYQLHHAYTSP